MIAYDELTEQAFQLYKKIFNLSNKSDLTPYQEGYVKCLADKCLKRYERRLMKLLGCK